MHIEAFSTPMIAMVVQKEYILAFATGGSRFSP